jgi:hypothetical protein
MMRLERIWPLGLACAVGAGAEDGSRGVTVSDCVSHEPFV